VAARLLSGAVLANLILVWILFFTAAPAKNSLLATGRFLGLNLAFALLVQLVLISRLPYLDRRIGMDRLTGWHRLTGFTIFWLVLLHPTFVLLGYGDEDHKLFLRELSPLAKQPPVLAGMCAATIVVIAAGLSIRAARRRLSYEAWHAVHVCLYVAITLALLHQLVEGTAFKTNTITRIYWYALWVAALGSLITGRLVLPLTRNARHRFKVAAVVPESDNVVSVHITGRDLDRLPAQAGQFFIWRFPGYGGWWRANPFSLSAAPQGNSLRLTAKGIGATSRGLRHVPVGTRVFAEGPYGAFTAAQRVREDSLLIAGGVGITPIRALLEVLPGDVVLLYRVRSEADAVLWQELETIARQRGARIHLLSGRTGAGNQPLSSPRLAALVPDIAGRDVFVCGPAPMTDSVILALRQLGVPRDQVHSERFRLAG
jgi:predicted ferric reductase